MTAAGHVAAYEFAVLVLMQFLVVAERVAGGWACHDGRMGHGGCGVITPRSSGVRNCVAHYGFAQFVAKCVLDPVAAYLAYRRSVKSDWSSLSPIDCWIHTYTFSGGHVRRLSATEVTWHERITTG